ncbi:MAG: enoyl-CoA hydratase/isomerase family protein [Desulfomonilaceae bacterium]|nr:enoyl-CoA hydratase/isomerase family protein [Desulfomonilaceae bacterium]
MSWNHILFEKKDNVATLTLNRPEKYNAFGGRMREEIREAVDDFSCDGDARVLVITGAGKAFCSGGDVDEFVSGETQALSEVASNVRHTMCRAVLAIHSVEKPVIAAVNGVAAGGGCNLALSCDIRIAGDRARFGQVFTRIGAHPDWGGIYFLPRLVGYAKAAELIWSAEIIDAREALRLGMVNRVVPQEQLMEAVYELAGRIAKNAPLPIAFSKRGLRNFHRWDLEAALDYEAYVLEVIRSSHDMMEGFKSFLEKREPHFKGC